MDSTRIYPYITFAVLALIAIGALWFARRKEFGKMSPWTGLAFGFVVAGVFCGENRELGYGLIGIGITLSVYDIFLKFKKRK